MFQEGRRQRAEGRRNQLVGDCDPYQFRCSQYHCIWEGLQTLTPFSRGQRAGDIPSASCLLPSAFSGEQLPKEYPFVHVYAQQKNRQPVIIKANTEGLSALMNAIVSAIAYPQNNGVAEVFDGDAENYRVLVQLVNTHEELLPLPYQE